MSQSRAAAEYRIPWFSIFFCPFSFHLLLHRSSLATSHKSCKSCPRRLFQVKKHHQRSTFNIRKRLSRPKIFPGILDQMLCQKLLYQLVTSKNSQTNYLGTTVISCYKQAKTERSKFWENWYIRVFFYYYYFLLTLIRKIQV